MRRISLITFLLLSVVCTGIIYGQSPLTIRLQPFLTNLALPTLIKPANDGTKRLFILQQKGIIKVVQPGENTYTDFMNITSKVNQNGGEQGLLGIAFHPQFATNHFFFVDYTATNGSTVIARYTANNDNTLGDPNSERILLTIPDPFSNHNGGMLNFGPDGNLYVGLGDGGSANDPGNRAQNVNEYWGKMLRITPDLAAAPTAPQYTSPSDNPFFGATAGLDEIYALGLRNPWRWSFDRGGTHQMWVADVGQGAIEEFGTVTLGGNYGWRVFEGTQCTNLDATLCANPPTTYIPPVSQYGHSGGRCSITGGYIYRGTQNNLVNGSYIYADYCTGEIWTWFNGTTTPMLDTTRLITSFGEDEDGELYVVGQGSGSNGTIDKIVRGKASADFDGDFKTDISVFRPSTGAWYITNSSNSSFTILNWGSPGDVPAPDDYNGDNISDIAIYRPSSGGWYILNSGGTVNIYNWGLPGDIPAVGDFDGDAKADVTVFRPSNGTWYIQRSSDGAPVFVNFGLSGDKPTVGDYDADGKADISVFRPSTGVWYSLNSINGGLRITQWGVSGDVPAQGDFDGDGRTDLAVYRVTGSVGTWYTLRTGSGAITILNFGNQNDIPTVGDFDGDAKEDVGVWRTTDGFWYRVNSSNGAVIIQQFGLTGDQPAPTFDAP
jgi:glucose/arabinose dehydrogenase